MKPFIDIVFSNLSQVIIDELRVTVRTLCLSERGDIPGQDWTDPQRRLLAGFGSSCLWNVFDTKVDTIEYQLNGHDLSIGNLRLKLEYGSLHQPRFQVRRFEEQVNDLDERTRYFKQVIDYIRDEGLSYWGENAVGAIVTSPDVLREIWMKTGM